MLPTGHAALLALQRSAGNRAVAAMLGPAPRPVVQRDVGFEFENRLLLTRQFTDKFFSERKRTKPTKRAGEWLTKLESRPKFQKNHPLLAHPDVALKTDDSGGESDSEFVTTHFPEDQGGRIRLDAAFTMMDQFEARLEQLSENRAALTSDLAGNGLAVQDGKAIFIPGSGAYSRGFVGGAQMTIGLGLADIPRVIDDLIGIRGQESGNRFQRRQPGRAAVRPLNQRTPPSGYKGAGGLVDGVVLADAALNTFGAGNAPNKPFNNAAGASGELRGLLTLIYSITETAKHPSSSFLKSTSDLLAKTHYGALFGRLPRNERLYFAGASGLGNALRITDLVGSPPSYQGTMGRPVFDNAQNTSFGDEIGGHGEWYHQLTRQAWVEEMTRGRDLLTTDLFPNLPRGRTLEGFGALGPNMDRVGNRDLPVFELRSFSGEMKVSQFHPVALKLFDYIVSVNQGNPQRIQ